MNRSMYMLPILLVSAIVGMSHTLTAKQVKRLTQRDCPGTTECIADYVIVGAGAGGCVVAARLAQAGNSVIVLEAGPDTSLDSKNALVQCDKDLIALPLNFTNLYNRFNECPFSPNCGLWNATQTLADFVSTDQNGIYYAYPRGVGAGGSTGHHAMQDGIGSLQVYENIAALVEDPYWKGPNVQRLFTKMENSLFPNATECGTGGWLSVQHTQVEPLLKDFATTTVVTIKVPYRDTFCDPQDVAGVGNSSIQVNADGTRSYAYQDLLVPTMQETGLIQVEFDTLAFEIILEKNKKKCPNEYRAAGVKAYNKAYLQEVQPGGAFTIICPETECSDIETCVALQTDNSLPKKPTIYRARKEVIICGGAIQSPQLLMLSGIGPREHLQSVGIEPKLDCPGVGKDLMDHCEVVTMFDINPRVYVPTWQAHVLLAFYPTEPSPTNPPSSSVLDPEVYAVCKRAVEQFPNFIDQNTGAIQWDWFSSGISGIQPGEKYPFPDVHTVPYQAFVFNFDLTQISPQYPGNYFDFNRNQLLPNINNPLDQTGVPTRLAMASAQFAAPVPRVYLSHLTENLVFGSTKGTVRLASNDPRQAPIIKEQLYEDDEGIEHMALAIQQVRDVMNNRLIPEGPNAGKTIKEVYSIPGQPFEIIPGPSPEVADVAGLKQYIKDWSSFGHHIGGTCQMGATNKKTGQAKNPRSVCDSHCRVFGVDKLRIADTSVYPTPWLHAFNTSRAAYLIGEAVSEFIISGQ